MATIDIYKSEVTKILTDSFAKQWADNGHKLSNDMIDSMKITIRDNLNEILIQVIGNDYGVYMDRGVKASQIPYSQGKGRGGNSLYIQGLMSYVAKRIGFALGSAENKKIAFAIAAKQKKVGMPIRTLGRGTGWVSKSVRGSMDDIIRQTQIYLSDVLNYEIQKNLLTIKEVK